MQGFFLNVDKLVKKNGNWLLSHYKEMNLSFFLIYLFIIVFLLYYYCIIVVSFNITTCWSAWKVKLRVEARVNVTVDIFTVYLPQSSSPLLIQLCALRQKKGGDQHVHLGFWFTSPSTGSIASKYLRILQSLYIKGNECQFIISYLKQKPDLVVGDISEADI